MNNLNSFIQKNGLDAFKKLAYHFTSNYNYNCILDSCKLKTGVYEGKYEFLAAFGAEKIVQNPEELEKYKNENNWFFGVVGYDLKNKFEELSSLNSEIIQSYIDPICRSIGHSSIDS